MVSKSANAETAAAAPVRCHVIRQLPNPIARPAPGAELLAGSILRDADRTNNPFQPIVRDNAIESRDRRAGAIGATALAIPETPLRKIGHDSIRANCAGHLRGVANQMRKLSQLANSFAQCSYRKGRTGHLGWVPKLSIKLRKTPRLAMKSRSGNAARLWRIQ
jgi:hypothetical protein